VSQGDGFTQSLLKARSYGIDEFLEIINEMSQQSSRKGALSRKEKELITLGMALAKDCSRCISIHSKVAQELGASRQEIVQVQKIALFYQASPHSDSTLWPAWEDSWRDFVKIHGSLEHYLRELIALGIALIRQHKNHITLHARSALDYGASKDQVFEVMPLALLMDGAPAVSQIPRLVAELETKAS
jgi:AhpD family alkylhydroperoxidase